MPRPRVKPSKSSSESCQVCGGPFTRKAYWQKYCSKSCRLAAWALRKHRLVKLVLLACVLVLCESALAAESRRGTASWFSTEACRVNPDPRCPTASGPSLRHWQSVKMPYAASFAYPLGTWLIVQGPSGQTKVVVLDAGPNPALHRLLDLNPDSFQTVCGDISQGLCKVSVKRSR